MVRLGAPLKGYDSPETWIATLQEAGYRAAYCPVAIGTDSTTVQAYAQAAKDADIVIAEVGAWSNPLSPDEATRQEAMEKCRNALALADEIGANCCVNISGSLGEQWDGPHPDNMTPDTFDLIVETTRSIIDAVKPTRTIYSLEPMPFLYPDSVDSYVALVKAIDREACGFHFDPVNLISSPQLYYNNTAFLQDAFAKIGEHIVSCHAKDIILRPTLTVHLDEVVPGEGNLDYKTFLRLAHQCNVDMPIMLEHLPDENYPQAAAFVKETATALNIPF